MGLKVCVTKNESINKTEMFPKPSPKMFKIQKTVLRSKIVLETREPREPDLKIHDLLA